jgi:hypothetical protein
MKALQWQITLQEDGGKGQTCVGTVPTRSSSATVKENLIA